MFMDKPTTTLKRITNYHDIYQGSEIICPFCGEKNKTECKYLDCIKIYSLKQTKQVKLSK